MGWEDAPIVQAAAAPAPTGWESAPIAFHAQGPRNADGIADAFTAGWQGSATGLIARGKLPDVVLDPQHSTWAQRLTAGATQMASELPEMIAGGVAGGAAGAAVGSAVPVLGTTVGGVLGGGAGTFAVPTAIRESLIQAYSKGEVTGSGDFLGRASIVAKATGRDALIGALTGGAGKVAQVGVAPLLGERVLAGQMAAGAARAGTTAATLGAEGTMLTVAPAALEGRLPEPEDFVNTAIMLLGFKAAGAGAGKLREIYARTGKTPMEVAADAAKDPTIVEDLNKPPAEPAASEPPPPAPGMVRMYHGSAEHGRYDGKAWFSSDKKYAENYRQGAELQYVDMPAKRINDIIDPDGYGQTVEKGFTANAEFDSSETGTRKPYYEKKVAAEMGANADPMAEYGPEIPRAYEALARDVNARDAVPDPSPDTARAHEFVEKPFADVPQMPGEPVLPTHVNYNYLNTTADVQQALSRLSGLYEQEILKAKRDTVPWEQTYQEARALFEQTTGQKAPEAPTEANYRTLSADLYAQKQLLVSGVEQLMQQRADYVQARTEGRANDQMKVDLLAQIERVAQAQATTRGAQAEVGRALNILKSTNRDKAYYDEVNRLITSKFGVEDGQGPIGKVVGDANFDKMVDLMGGLGSPREALAFADRASRATTWDKVMEAWKAGLVSGPWTQAANILGNATFMATRPFVDLTAVAFGLARNSADRVTAVEPLARVVGNIQGTIDGAKAFTAVLRTGSVDSAKAEVHRAAIEGLKGDIIRTPFRLLSAADAFFRVSNERGEAYALASREAASEGFNPATREFRDRVLELATSPTQAMEDAITAAGTRFTFNTPLGEKGQAIQAAIRKTHSEWMVPFVQTPANVAKEMLRLTPLAPMVGEWRDAIAKGGAARDQAIAEMVMGTAVSTTVFSLALSGHVSGSGDPDPKKRAVQMAAGWQPYSVKVGDKWYSYQRLQPVGTVMGMAADMANVWEHMTPEESDKVPKILATAFANAITNQTFLQGITQVVNAISDPGRFGPRFAQGMVSSVVPAVVGQTAQMMDPYQREIDSVKDAVQARIPGLRQDLFPKRDPFGDAVPAKDRMGEISPITATTESQDKVRKEAARLGVGAAKAPDHIELPAGHDKQLGKVKLDAAQQDIFATEAGHLAYHVLSQIVNQPTWDNMPDMAQRNAMNSVFEHARLAGRAAAVGPEQLARESERIANELRHRMAQGK